MLDIRIDGEPADLLPGTSVTLERFNPLLDFEKVEGSRVYGFELPDTPTNRRLLGYFYQPQVGYTERKFRCDKYFAGQLIEQGYVMIHQVKETGFSLYFSQNLGEIFGDYQNVLLSELPLWAGPVPASPVAAANHLVDSFALPTVQNDSFYGNQVVGGYNGLMNEWAGGNYNTVARVPMFFLGWVFRQFGQLTGWQFDGGFWTDPAYARLLLYNTYSLDGLSVLESRNHLPELTLPGLLMELRRVFNLYLAFDVRRQVCTVDLADTVLATSEVVDWTQKAAPQHTKVPDLANRLELGFDLDGNDALMKPIPADLDKYVTAGSTGTTTVIRSKLSTLLTDATSGRAVTRQTGISSSNKDNKTGGSPRLLFWNGVVGGQPLATNAQGTRRLAWHGPSNLVDGGYRGFEAFKADTFSDTRLVYLTAADLATFSFRRKVHIRGVNYIVGSLKAALGAEQQTVPTEVTLWRA